MKTLKVENEYYDKVKALSDASGESLNEAANGVVSAGLGELEGLADALKGNLEVKGSKKQKLTVPIGDEEITITEANREPEAEKKAKPKVKVVEATDTEERQFFCLECEHEVKVSESQCPACGTVLNWSAVEEAVGEETEGAEGNGGWVWFAAALIGFLALKGRIQRNGIQRFV